MLIQTKYQGACWVFLAACFYATVAILGKWLHVLQLPMATVFSWRYAIAVLVLWIVIQFQEDPALPLKSKFRCFVAGLIGDTSRTALFFITISRIGVSMASLLLYTFPFFVFLIQHFVFKQAASRQQWLGLVFSSLGCILAIAPYQGDVGAWNDWIGVATGVGTGIVQAIYITYSSRFLKGIPAVFVSSYVTRGALVSFAFVALYTGKFVFPATLTEWTLAFSLAVCATVIPLFCLMKGIRLAGATQTSILLTIEPVITIGLATILFAESLTLSKLLGVFLILGSALLIQKREYDVERA